MSIGIGLHCWWCERGPCNGTCYEQNTKPIKKSMNLKEGKTKSNVKKIKYNGTMGPPPPPMGPRKSTLVLTETDEQRIRRLAFEQHRGKIKPEDVEWLIKMTSKFIEASKLFKESKIESIFKQNWI